MSLLAWITLGLIAGYIASRVVDNSGRGLFRDITLGILGAVAGGWLFSAFGMARVPGINLYSLPVACLGAGSLLMAFHVGVRTSLGRRPAKRR
jgi:uncharacterized membrane protein YeaQ/YmgE (transglycosylase-associated protein family)